MNLPGPVRCPNCNSDCYRDQDDAGRWRCQGCGWYEGQKVDALIDAEREQLESSEMNEHILKVLCRWWSTLNSWGWPEDFTIPKPDKFEDMGKEERANAIRPLRRALESLAPQKEILRYWNTIHLEHGMTDAQFEVWWQQEGRLQ